MNSNTNQNLDIMLDKIIVILQLLRRPFYNRITKILVIAGLGLISTPFWQEVFNIFLFINDIPIIGEYDVFIGIGLIVFALIYNTYHKWMELKYGKENEPAYIGIKFKKFKTFGELCQSMLPVFRDNEYIFISTGPNSHDDNAILRRDFTLWESLRKEVIVPNNDALAKMIQINRSLIPHLYFELFSQLILHISAFKKHVDDPYFDYSEFQFPKKIVEVAIEASFEYAKKDKKLLAIERWIAKNINSSDFNEVMIFGSSLTSPSSANDVDVAIMLSDGLPNHIITKMLNDLKIKFVAKFSKALHLTIFTNAEAENYDEFKAKNNYKKLFKNGKELTLLD